jgi:hypothetical protein
MRHNPAPGKAATNSFELMRGTCLALAVILLVGCAKQANPIHVRGTVTYRGKPVPGGLVVIHPDTTKGNQGQRGYAAIKNGQFDTSVDNGKGAAPGAVKFAVGGAEEVDPDPEMGIKPLFPTYQFEAEVSPTNTTFDINVPG